MPRPMISGPYRTFRRLNLDQTFLEFEGSTITIPMRGRRSLKDPWMEDDIQLQAFMRLEIYPPYMSNLGTREFQFTIRDWNLYGKSPMLNRLFFDDPLGYAVRTATGAVDYVPAVVTFNVNNHYHVGVDEKSGLPPSAIFASEKLIEIRNLTSHDLRTWTRYPQREGQEWLYSQPNPRIYWQILPGAAVEKTPLMSLVPEKDRARAASQPFILFHKKPPPPGERHIDAFDAADSGDSASFLLAAAPLEPTRPAASSSAWVSAKNPIIGHRGNRVQIEGNSITSQLYRPRDGVDIRFAASPELSEPNRLNGMVLDASKRAGTKGISGWIEIVSPARSLGVANQGPDVGAPIDSADFPARITYAINYNIFVNNQQFIEDQAGIAIADGCLEVPPRDVTVAFEKIHIGQVLEQYLEFDKGHCTGMHEITAAAFHEGTNFSRYWRTVPLRTTEMSNFQDYDPTKEY